MTANAESDPSEFAFQTLTKSVSPTRRQVTQYRR